MIDSLEAYLADSKRDTFVFHDKQTGAPDLSAARDFAEKLRAQRHEGVEILQVNHHVRVSLRELSAAGSGRSACHA